MAKLVQKLTGEDLQQFVATSGGIGSAEAIVGYLKSKFPDALGQVGDEILQTIVGIALVKLGPRAKGRMGSYIKNFGTGVLYHLVGRLIKENLVDKYFHGSPPYSTHYSSPLMGAPRGVAVSTPTISSLESIAKTQSREIVPQENFVGYLDGGRL